MLLFIVRHGKPTYEPDELTPEGWAQARTCAPRFARHGLDKIYASPMIRAQQTAQPTAEALGMEINIEPWMSEALAWEAFRAPCGDGYRWAFDVDRRNLLTPECIRPENYEKWYELPPFEQIDGKKAYQRVCDASDGFFAKLGYERDGALYRVTKPNEDRIAAFCHQGFGTIWLSHICNIPPHLYWARFAMSYTAVSAVYFENTPDGITYPRILCLSDLSHIYASDEPFRLDCGIDM